FCIGGKEAKITSVVGPNGSGKSNVADAIRWVLGEQSYKLLRSKKSEDVIFSGSEKKSKGSYSEVVLVLDNANKSLKIDFTEVAFSRRLYRSGENEYRINGSKVRLLDIQELLAKCGFGQATYTVIGQGMVDQMLFYGAKERKVLFDEAAGVKQYELKREQSLRKLEATDQNLVRVKDILVELEPRLRQLKRQVEKAEEKEVVEKELKDILLKYYSYKWNRLDGYVQKKEKESKEMQNEKEKVEKELESMLEKLEGEEKGSFENIESLRNEVSKVSEERDTLKEKYIMLSGNIRVEEEKENFESGNRLLEERDAKAAKLLNIEEEIAQKEKFLKNEEMELATLLKQMTEIQTRLLESSSLLRQGSDGGDENLFKLKKDYSDLVKEQDDLIKVLEKARSISDIQKARDKSRNIGKLLTSFWEKIKRLNKKDNQSEVLAKIEKISAEKDGHFAKISEVKSKISSYESYLSNLDNQKSFLIGEIGILEKSIESFKGKTENKVKIEGMKKKMQDIKVKLEEEEKKIEDIRENIRAEEEKERKRGMETVELRTKTREKQSLIDQYNYTLRDIAVESAKYDTRKDDLKESIAGEVEGGLEALKNISPENLDEDQAAEKIRKLRQKISVIGGIDEDVKEEHKESSERYEYLSGQLTDLDKAKEDLRKIISELDDRIKVQFGTAFQKISTEFKKYFSVLFEGGHADLTIRRVEDDLGTSDGNTQKVSQRSGDSFGVEEERGGSNSESSMGIEITACPPGKKVKNLNALSGGERTLTSLALLFAILSVNPSPFCVLDEVDAALDEANTKRFLKILSTLAASTQFIVITHNRDTMRTADILYGVTMDSEHVSKLLSLRLKEAEAAVK
ncbi:hypothetical protein COY62_02660, partial [bacterium (Candidatus Howlettbacteria) CG_4_10_14_0_8_um_filter_40_9]